MAALTAPLLSMKHNTDPVCGIKVAANTPDTLLFKGKTYGFCSVECHDEFAALTQRGSTTAYSGGPAGGAFRLFTIEED